MIRERPERCKKGEPELPYDLQADSYACVLVDVGCSDELTVLSDKSVQALEVDRLTKRVAFLPDREGKLCVVRKDNRYEGTVRADDRLC